MEFAKSLLDGKLYKASLVSYSQTTKLKLVCTQCHQKVFKTVRSSPSELHFFCHHPGVGLGCDLYHAGGLDGVSWGETGILESKGQFLKIFLENVADDIKNCIYASKILNKPINKTKFINCTETSKDLLINLKNRGSLLDISSLVNNYCKGLTTEVRLHSNVITDFYKNEQSRFVDKIIFTWICYYFDQELPNCDLRRLSRVLVDDSKIFENFCGVFIVGLASYYKKQPLLSLKANFLSNVSKIAVLYHKETSKNFNQIEGVLPPMEGRISTTSYGSNQYQKLVSNKWILLNNCLINEIDGIKISKDNFTYVDDNLKGFEIRGNGALAWIPARNVLIKI